jgi:hypothetical protein
MRGLKWLLKASGLAVVGLIVAPIGNDFLSPPCLSEAERCLFETERWRAGNRRQRARIVADLQSSKILVGKSRAEVSALLGPPDRDGWSDWSYYYAHGDHLMPIWDWVEWVWVEFDESGQVRKVELRD